MPKLPLPPITGEEEARIQAGIAQDPDAPEMTDGQAAQMRPAAEVLPPVLYAALTRAVGPQAPRQRSRDGSSWVCPW
ncbi:hypothetical protein [Methylobacterium indicum]|uniref:Uncharacterized protein n=1 Tax=Methylobacterium indicum TaxID=1775910 RepID=A0A8H9CA87_9HYPH|nr:hypothetical protein [Methylobacterium indicum]BCM88068.1 hypothetical protein mvi_65290 [Methylobacterium indicum]